jgi:hypothetical protein
MGEAAMGIPNEIHDVFKFIKETLGVKSTNGANQKTILQIVDLNI